MQQPRNPSHKPPSQQSWDPERYARNAGFVPVLGDAIFNMLAPQADEDILDLGCGDGVLSARLAEAGARVMGVDASAEQVVAAAQIPGVEAQVMSGAELSFSNQFDAVFSNAALHWMLDPDAVIAGVWKALRAGGRFVGEFGGFGNVHFIRTALHAELKALGLEPTQFDPWYFPTPEDYSGRLQAAGFEVPSIELIPRPTPLPGDIYGWLETFAEPFLHAVADDQRAALVDRLRERLSDDLKDPATSGWFADYVRLRFVATKPAASQGNDLGDVT